MRWGYNLRDREREREREWEERTMLSFYNVINVYEGLETKIKCWSLFQGAYRLNLRSAKDSKGKREARVTSDRGELGIGRWPGKDR